MSELAEKRPRLLFVVLVVVFVISTGIFVLHKSEQATEDQLTPSHDSTDPTPANPTPVNPHNQQNVITDDPVEPTQSQPTFMSTAIEYFRVQIRLNWVAWLSAASLLVTVVAGLIVLWHVAPILFNPNNIDPFETDKEDPVVIEPEPEPELPFYQQVWFIVLVGYLATGLILFVVDLVYFKAAPFIALDQTNKIKSGLAFAPIYFAILPVYALCSLVLGIFVKLNRFAFGNATLKYVLVVACYFVSIPFQLVLLVLETVRMLFVTVLSKLFTIDSQAEWLKLGTLATNLFMTPFTLFTFDDTAMTQLCDNIVRNHQILSKL